MPTRSSLLAAVIAATFIAPALSACSKSATPDSLVIQQACYESVIMGVKSFDKLSLSERAALASAAEKRSQAADQIASIDARYTPLAEALNIISDAATSLNQSADVRTAEIDWDLVKLAQAAAADQCELLSRLSSG